MPKSIPTESKHFFSTDVHYSFTLSPMLAFGIQVYNRINVLMLAIYVKFSASCQELDRLSKEALHNNIITFLRLAVPRCYDLLVNNIYA